MKLASVNTQLDFDIEGTTGKDVSEYISVKVKQIKFVVNYTFEVGTT